MSFSLDPPGPYYKKPFHLFHYNKPKLPPLKTPKPVKYKDEPKIPIKYNNATKMRNKVIKEYSIRDLDPFMDYTSMSHESIKGVTEEPEYLPRDTKTTQFRYKWIRDIPVVSCRFTEHVMMYRKPPFIFEKKVDTDGMCGRYKLRTMIITEPPKHIDVEDEETSSEFMPGILQ